MEELKEIISVILLANAATGHKDESMTDYMEVLETILRSGNDNH